MLTIKLVSKPTKNDTIVVRVTNNRRLAEFSLGLKATQTKLSSALSQNPDKDVMHLSKVLKIYSAKIEEARAKILELNMANYSASALASFVKAELMGQEYEVADDKMRFASFYIKRMAAKGNKGYKASIEYTFKKMQDFCKSKMYEGKPLESLDFEDINLKWLNAFDEWLLLEGSAKNSRNIHFKNIRTVINRAIDEDLTDKYPFRRFKIRAESTPKKAMLVEDLRTLLDFPVEEYQRFYLDMFKLIFLLVGINTTDLYNLSEIVNGRIEYRRAKTHRLYSIKVEPEAMEIIERWRGEKNLLCIADRWKDPKDFNKNMNIALKKIGKHERAKGRGGRWKITPAFPGISTYWARHSWATIALNDCDISKDIISQALGHSMGSDITEIYIRRDERKVDEANRKVIDWVWYGKK
ncbi:MAG: site-specific integrase [Bacteroides sp.]|nr:site-specific integrase [Bacteroides sp.]